MGDFLDKFMRGSKFKSYWIVCWWRCGELFWPGDKSAEEVCLERLRVGLNCLWYLAVVVIIMGLGGAKRLVGLGGIDPSRHHGSEWLLLSFDVILTRKIHHNICILSISLKIFIVAINKLTNSLEVSNLTSNLINWSKRVM